MAGAHTPALQLHPSLRQGLLLYREGDLEAAEKLYRVAHDCDPEDPEAMLLLGVVAREQQRVEDAVAWTQRAVLSQPHRAYFHLNLGMAHLARPDLLQAKQSFQAALALEPQSALAWCRLGEVADRGEQPEHASTCYARALELDPRCWGHYLATARLRRAQGRAKCAADLIATAARAFPRTADLLLEAARESMELGQDEQAAVYCAQAARCCSQSAEIQMTWAEASRRLGKLLQAVMHFECAHRLDPANPHALHGLGLACFQLGRGQDAVRCFRGALDLRPEDAGMWHDLARTYAEMQRLDEGIPCARRATELDPANALYWNTLGTVLISRNPEEAERCYRAALARTPDFAEAIVNLGITWMLRGFPDETIHCYQRALELDPDLAGARYNLSLAYLKAGRYAEAWPHHEARWRFSELRLTHRHTGTPLWTGQPLAGQTILLHAEQGLGDTLQFLRFVPMVAARQARVLLEVPASLLRLVQTLHGPEHVFARGEPLPTHVWQCPLMSLPLAFSTTIQSIPQGCPYLSVGSHAVQSAWQAFPGKGLRVGIVWAGSPHFRSDSKRSIPLEQILPLARIPGVHLVSLQKGSGAEQLEALPPQPAATSLVDAGASFEDFADTAALMATLDLVIGVDTSCVHLAGALGRNVWVLLPYHSDWRWLQHDEASPWYPTARLFRQSVPDDWSTVVASVAEALREHATSVEHSRVVYAGGEAEWSQSASNPA